MAEEISFEQKLAPADRRDVDAFKQLQNTLFPDGKIPTQKELLVRLADKPTVRDAFIATMYDTGIPPQPGLSKLNETKSFYKKFENAFSKKVVDYAKGTTPTLQRIQSVLNKGVTLDTPFSELLALADSPEANFSEAFITKNISPLETGVQHGRNKKYSSRTSGSKGTKMLTGAGQDIPPQVLESILTGISEIDDQIIKVDGKEVPVPAQIMRDAVMVATLGYRGKDIVESRTTLELATSFGVPRPYYDSATKTVKSPPATAKGRGRKKAGPDRPVGPVVGGVLDRRYTQAGVTGELFPDIETKHITQSLRDHVWKKIPKEVIDIMTEGGGRAPSDFTDLRRIIGAAIANRLGMPEIAGEVLNHAQTSAGDVVDKVTSGYYIRVMDKGLEQRGQALLMFEKMMADAVGANDAKGLADRLGLNLDPNFNAIYPTDEEFKSDDFVTAKETEVSPERQASSEKVAIATDEAAAAQLREQSTAADLQSDANIRQRAADLPATEQAVRDIAQSDVDVAAKTKEAKKQAKEASGKSLFEKAMSKVRFESGIAATALAAKIGFDVVKSAPGGVFDLIEVGTEAALRKEGEEDRFDIAQQKGAQLAEGLNLPKQVGEGPAVTAELLTGAVADPQGAMTLAQQAASLFGPIKAQLPQVTKLIEESRTNINVPDPAPTDQGDLEAADFKKDVNTARSQAMKNEPTSMGELMARGGKIPSFL